MSKEIAFKIFDRCVKEVTPKYIISKKISLKKDTLFVGKERYNLNKYKGLYIFGAGKASIEMAYEAEKILGDKISGGFVVGTKDKKLKRVTTFVSSHPVPTLKSLKGGEKLKREMEKLGRKDLYIFFLSGGASALIEVLKKPLKLKDLKETTNVLLKSGADIDDMNVIRKAISLIKGGKLAQNVKAEGSVVVFSDVMGDPLETIGSAPMYNKKAPSKEKIKKIIKQYNLKYNLPESVMKILKNISKEKKQREKIPHQIVVNNQRALKAAKKASEKFGYNSYLLPMILEGEAVDMAEKLASFAKNVQKNSKYKLPACLIVGGETTVTLKGDGKGGRNQEFILGMMKYLKATEGISYFSGGTDGIDGNSSAAGAYGDSSVFKLSLEKKLDIEKFLEKNDSNLFFSKTNSLLNIGYTGTNVTDVALIFIEER